jgi:hypothetical protein
MKALGETLRAGVLAAIVGCQHDAPRPPGAITPLVQPRAPAVAQPSASKLRILNGHEALQAFGAPCHYGPRELTLPSGKTYQSFLDLRSSEQTEIMLDEAIERVSLPATHPQSMPRPPFEDPVHRNIVLEYLRELREALIRESEGVDSPSLPARPLEDRHEGK